MNKLSAAEQKALDNLSPGLQNARLGGRLKDAADNSLVQVTTVIPAGATGVVTPIALPLDPDLLFDFEVVDVIVRTDTSVALSTVQGKQGTNAFTDAIVSAVANALTRAGQMIDTYNDFYPRSNPAGYAAAPCNLVDAGGATAAARTVTVVCRRI